MLVKMKRYEKLAGDHAKKFAKAWDYYCVATGAYLEAYKQAKEDILNGLNGEEEVEVQYLDGEHQLSAATFKKWKDEQNG
jgi:hypothetical protein